MRLDAQLRDFILETWAAVDERQQVAAALQPLDDGLRANMIMAREIGAPDAVRITENVLVVTRDVIALGWPAHEHNVVWRRPGS